LLHLLTAGYGTSRPLRNVRLESAKWVKADIDRRRRGALVGAPATTSDLVGREELALSPPAAARDRARSEDRLVAQQHVDPLEKSRAATG
jgi:hypothetical protein